MITSNPTRIAPFRPALRIGVRLRLAPLKTFARWYDRYVQRRTLAELDARMLADIGVTPEKARQEIRKPFWR